MTWQPIETFAKHAVEADDSGISKDGPRVFLFFPDIVPHELIGCCRGTPCYGGVYYEWVDDEGDPIESSKDGRIEPSHWAPMLAPPQVTHSQRGER